MPGAEHSTDLKDRVHHLSSMDFAPKEISILLALPLSTVYRILKSDPGSFDTKKPSTRGRPRKLLRDDVAFILETVEMQPDIFLDELKEEMELQGIEISLASLCRYLHRNGMSNKKVCLFLYTYSVAHCFAFSLLVLRRSVITFVVLSSVMLCGNMILVRSFRWMRLPLMCAI
jgi:hypothetical protein